MKESHTTRGDSPWEVGDPMMVVNGDRLSPVSVQDDINTEGGDDELTLSRVRSEADSAVVASQRADDRLSPASSEEGDLNTSLQEEDQDIVDEDLFGTSPADFLLKPPIAEEEIRAVSPAFYERIEVPLEQFRKEGFAAYQAYLLMEKEKLEDQARLEESRRLEYLKDAAIVGEPRDYQNALYEVAKKRNTIINLGTGKGKTLIALLVIRHFAPAFEEGKQTLFLVPSVALAIQQHVTLHANLPYKVAKACRDHTTTAAEPAHQKLAEANVIVATHGAMHDLLMHHEDSFQMKRFNLIILDECHYATRNHVYASIMSKFYHSLPREDRPHVLGLTASPLLNVKHTHSDDQLESMLGQLERKLDCKLVCVKDLDIDQGMNLLYKPAEERHIVYQDMIDTLPLPSCENVGLHKSRVRECQQLDQLYEDLGPLAVSIYSRTLAEEISRNDFEKETMDEFRCVVQHLLRVADFCDARCQYCPRNGRSNKLLALEEQLELLIERDGSADTVGLVFVERRITAMALQDYFRTRQKRLDEGAWIRAARTRPLQQLKLVKGNAEALAGASAIAAVETAPIHNHDEVSDQFDDCDDDVAGRFLTRAVQSPGHGYIEAITTEPIEFFDSVPGQFDDASESECGDSESFAPVLQVIQKDHDDESEVEASSVVSGQFSHAEDGSEIELPWSKPVEDGFDESHVGESIRSGAMVRRATHIFKYLNRGDRSGYEEGDENDTWLHKDLKIREVVRKLRKHEINVLFATSIVEEGMDIQACSFVIVFDSLKSAKGYIQMKGRARQAHATFVVLQSESKMMKGQLSLYKAQCLERRVHDYIEKRDIADYAETADVKPKLAFLLGDDSSTEIELRAIKAGGYQAKNGSVDLVSAKGLLNKYAMAIPLDPSSRTTRESYLIHMPKYENCQLMLPVHLPTNVRLVRLPEEYHSASTAERHQMLALIACVRLRRLRLLSDKLLPLTRTDLHNELRRVATKDTVTLPTYSSQTNVLFECGQREVYLYPILQGGERFQPNQKFLARDTRCLALLSTQKLPKDIPEIVYPHGQLGDTSCSLGTEQTMRMTLLEWEECAQFYATLFNGRWRRQTRTARYQQVGRDEAQGIISPYVVGCLSPNGDLDWIQMRTVVADGERTADELTKAAASFTGQGEPRVWAPLYDPNVPYISYGPSGLDCSTPFPDDLPDVDTFQDYFRLQRGFEVPKDSPLFVVQRFWHLQNEALSTRQLRLSRLDDYEQEMAKTLADVHSAPHHSYNVCEALRTVLLPRDAVMEMELADPYMALLCAILPQFLYHIDCNLTADSFRRHCVANLPCLGKCLEHVPRERVMEALSAKSARLEQCYDRLEWLGDAVLKIIQTDALLQTPDLRQWVQCLHEGDLTKLRSEMGCNDRLADSCIRRGLDKFILSIPLERGKWTPIQLKLYPVDQEHPERQVIEKQSHGSKVYADVVEALIGLVYLTCGYELTLEMARELGVSLPSDGSKTIFRGCPKYIRPGLLEAVQATTGIRSFASPQLVEEAFTHPSAVYHDVSSYQRLEWVGDAVLCLAMREWIYFNFQELEVGDLVNMESALASNETLSYLCFNNGLHTFITHRDQGLPARIEHYEWCVNEQGRGLWGTDPPKVLADVVESMLGAAHVDAGFSEGKKAALNILKPITTLLQNPANANCVSRLNNPKTVMHELAGACLGISVSKEVDFARTNPSELVWRGDQWKHADEGSGDYIASISCLGINVLSIVETSTTSARNRACAMVVVMLERDPMLVSELQRFRGSIDVEKFKIKR